MDLPEGSLSHERCQDLLVISEQMLKADLADILAGASISPKAILKAVSLASLSPFVTFNTRMSWYTNELNLDAHMNQQFT